MTVFNGVLLFDIPENTINGWENQLGFRGYSEVWKRGAEQITIEVTDDSREFREEWEVWWANNETGNFESLGFGSFEEVNNVAKEYMRGQ